MDDADFAGVLARAVTDKVKSEHPQGKLIPGTVVSYGVSDEFAGAFAVVHMVGDPPNRTLQVPVLAAHALTPGEMVMVYFDPPEGAYVLSSVIPPAVSTIPEVSWQWEQVGVRYELPGDNDNHLPTWQDTYGHTTGVTPNTNVEFGVGYESATITVDGVYHITTSLSWTLKTGTDPDPFFEVIIFKDPAVGSDALYGYMPCFRPDPASADTGSPMANGALSANIRCVVGDKIYIRVGNFGDWTWDIAASFTGHWISPYTPPPPPIEA